MLRPTPEAPRPLRDRDGPFCSWRRSIRFLFLAFREIRNHFLARRDRRAAAKSLVAELSRGRAAGVRVESELRPGSLSSRCEVDDGYAGTISTNSVEIA